MKPWNLFVCVVAVLFSHSMVTVCLGQATPDTVDFQSMDQPALAMLARNQHAKIAELETRLAEMRDVAIKTDGASAVVQSGKEVESVNIAGYQDVGAMLDAAIDRSVGPERLRWRFLKSRFELETEGFASGTKSLREGFARYIDRANDEGSHEVAETLRDIQGIHAAKLSEFEDRYWKTQQMAVQFVMEYQLEALNEARADLDKYSYLDERIRAADNPGR